jgi:hypothetical protein
VKTRLELEFDWKLKGNDGSVPLKVLQVLLEGIEQHGNLRVAAVVCGMSYRHTHREPCASPQGSIELHHFGSPWRV